MHSQTYPNVMVLILVISITFFNAYDWPMVASVDPSSSAACIVALSLVASKLVPRLAQWVQDHPGIETLPPVN